MPPILLVRGIHKPELSLNEKSHQRGLGRHRKLAPLAGPALSIGDSGPHLFPAVWPQVHFPEISVFTLGGLPQPTSCGSCSGL